LKRDVEKGKFAPFKIVFRDDPSWTGTIPVIRWQEPAGRWMFLGKIDSNGDYKAYGYDDTVVGQLKQLHGVQ
jgi:hypothetical protein